jgi:hypothetical protein
MRRRDIVLICSLLFTVVAGMFTYTYIAKQQAEPIAVTPEPVEEARETMRLDAKHFYRDGVHTIVGEVMMPTPCDLLSYEAVFAESFPEQVSYNFTVINNSEVCAQVMTPQRFMVSATASAGANLAATWNGVAIELNLVEAAPEETLESFELYFKG